MVKSPALFNELPPGKPMAYSLDLRTTALQLLDQKRPATQVAQLLSVGTATLYRWKKRQDQGQLQACYPKSRKPYKVDETALCAYLEEHRDAYQHEVAEQLGVSKSAIQWAMKRLGITRKKRHLTTTSAIQTSAKPTSNK